MSKACGKPTEADGRTNIHDTRPPLCTLTRLELLLANMGQILSWIRGPREEPALQNVSVEQQVCDTVFSCVFVLSVKRPRVLPPYCCDHFLSMCWKPVLLVLRCRKQDEKCLGSTPSLLPSCRSRWNAKLPVSLPELKVCLLDLGNIKHCWDKSCSVWQHVERNPEKRSRKNPAWICSFSLLEFCRTAQFPVVL